MDRYLIIRCGDAPLPVKQEHGNYDDWVIKASGKPAEKFRVIDPSKGDMLIHPTGYTATVITASAFKTNQRLPWIKKLKDWIVTARYSNTPLLGIDFGMHLIAESLGGEIKNNTKNILGTSFINLTEEGISDELFKDTGPSFESFLNFNRHVSQLPPEIKILAHNASNTIMAFRLQKILGFQFHPELNETIFKTFLRISKLPPSAHLMGKIRSEYKNLSVLPSFFS
jgi:GMP synthase (glutamine-hydrolysing)